MDKTIYLIRHCQATGQAPEAELTEIGKKQAKDLAEFFQQRKVVHFVSSPFMRAIQSIEPAAKQLGLPIVIDGRLAERILSSEDLSDWMEKLEASFEDEELKFVGGESGREATTRAIAALQDMKDGTAAVTHGNLLGLLLKSIDSQYDFSAWGKLTNPDVFKVEITNGQTSVVRLWQ
ncbi:histidine phosphatase family protein [Planococcus halocryophilus]|uniref:Histidine phosphatase family protein n=1 Tax=Planococcus halocryophilus TaxID=1215089 RepID=A0A1C7DRN8_9BACL|nr:histidine phosphatase family protein [Planococcus halocryophilus]ANU14249.1 histidine phosphatase family protein [Planococcus halocryophilus]